MCRLFKTLLSIIKKNKFRNLSFAFTMGYIGSFFSVIYVPFLLVGSIKSRCDDYVFIIFFVLLFHLNISLLVSRF